MRGGINIFRRKFFLSQSAENFRRENFCAAFEKASGSDEPYG